MNQQQRDLRRAASRAFIESLDKLQETLSLPEETAPASEVVASSNLPLSLEQAIADIERCMRTDKTFQGE